MNFAARHDERWDEGGKKAGGYSDRQNARKTGKQRIGTAFECAGKISSVLFVFPHFIPFSFSVSFTMKLTTALALSFTSAAVASTSHAGAAHGLLKRSASHSGSENRLVRRSRSAHQRQSLSPPLPAPRPARRVGIESRK